MCATVYVKKRAVVTSIPALQYSRMGVLDAFKSGTHHVLVATDVAARGLDIRTIKTVVCFDAARDFDTHIHRWAPPSLAPSITDRWISYASMAQREARSRPLPWR